MLLVLYNKFVSNNFAFTYCIKFMHLEFENPNDNYDNNPCRSPPGC
jgi:hypothetical protein